MSYFDNKQPPKREDRLSACIAHSGSICGLAKRSKCRMLDDGDREFTQGSICLMLPALGMLTSLPNTAVLMHGAVGCGSCIHGSNVGVRSGKLARQRENKDVLWLSTALGETDVIGGGEKKLEEALREVDRTYRPENIVIVSTCVPGIIGDDIDAVVAGAQPGIAARLLPVHCEGFKTKIWATAYDAVYHSLGRNLLDKEDQRPQYFSSPVDVARETEQQKRSVNIMNVSSMGRVDELELQRLLNSIGLTVNFFPVFSDPQEFYKVTQAALSVSTCPTHDDYFLKHLQATFGVPFIIRHMPIGIENTNRWLRDIADFFGLKEEAERVIERETAELDGALGEFRPLFSGKRVFVSAGEIRAFTTAALMAELGFEITGIRSFHHDEFAEIEYEKLAAVAKNDYSVSIANAQPFEEANLLKKLKPDVFLGHINGNSTAAKLGIVTAVIYNVTLSFMGYRGAYELARRLSKQLKNPLFNRNLSRNLQLPYRENWYAEDAFKYLRAASGGK